MTPNKLPPLPERVALTKLFAPWFIASLGDLTDDYAAMTLDDVEMALLANGEYILPIIEALRQSQSLPAGAVALNVAPPQSEPERPYDNAGDDTGPWDQSKCVWPNCCCDQPSKGCGPEKG